MLKDITWNEGIENENWKDCIGEMFVPDNVLYGIHSLRAKHNFPITNEKVDPAIIQSYLQIKKAAAIANEKAGTLDKEKSDLIVSACNQLLFSKDYDAFITPAIQGVPALQPTWTSMRWFPNLPCGSV